MAFKSDLPLTRELLSLFAGNARSQSPGPAPEPEPVVQEPRPRSAFIALPTAQLAIDSSGPPSLTASLGLLASRGASHSLKISAAAPLVNLQNSSGGSRSSASGSSSMSSGRKRLSSAAGSSMQLVSKLPVLIADHTFSYGRSAVNRVAIKASLDLSSGTWGADATWFAHWEGSSSPAKLRFKWAEGRPANAAGTLLFDAQLALSNSSASKLRLSGTPHQLHGASILLGPSSTSSSSSTSTSSRNRQRSSGKPQPAAAAAAGARPDDSNGGSSGTEPPASRAFDQAGLQLELGWNLQQAAPILSASRRFGGVATTTNSTTTTAASGTTTTAASGTSSSSSSGSWRLQQVKAAYDCKASSINLSAGGAAWNMQLAFPAEARGVLGLPRPCSRGGSCWPKVLLTLSPELSDMDGGSGGWV